MEEILVSVVIPVYNVSKHLSGCIESILNQRISNYEIILVDDGSTDNSGDICDYYSQSNKRIRTFHINNKGVAYARNMGASYAKGQYTHFVDSDDTLEVGMYKILEKIVNNFKYDIIITGTRYNNEINNTIEIYEANKVYDIKKKENIKDFLLNITNEDKGWALNVIWNKWIKTKLIKANNLLFRNDICPGEDFLFVLDVIKTSQSLYVCNHSYYNYAVRDNSSLLRKFYRNVLETRPKIYQKHIDLYTYYGIVDSYQNIIDLNEGKNTFKSLFSILNTNCKLSFKEKYSFIKEIIKSEHFKYVYVYLDNKNDLSARIYSYLLKLQNASIALVLIYLNVIRIKVSKRRKCV